nr:hypothetical protein [Tanacetum cinerariifolium]
MEFLNPNFQERELHQLQQMQDNAKESCMVSFQLLHSHLKALSNNDSKGTCIKGGFKRAFVALFDQDIQTFTGSIAKHKREKDRRVNDRMMKSKERKDNSSNAVDADLVVTESNETESESFSKPRFTSQIDVNIVLSKPVTPLVRESALAKPHLVNAPSSSRNNQKELYGSNDMAQNYYLEEAKKKTQDKNRNLKPREIPSTKTHHTPNACTPQPRSNNQTSRNWPASKSYKETLKAVQKAYHSRNPSLFLRLQTLCLFDLSEMCL